MQNLLEELNKIKEMELENPNEALQCYSDLLEKETEQRGEVCYRFGCFLHRFAEEEMALDLFVQAFGEGVCREEILRLLLQDFWEPNRDEFRKAYLKQTSELLKAQKELVIPDFDTLPYFMFPISDTQFMVFDRKKEQFAGWLGLAGDLEKKRLKEPEAFFPVVMDMKNSSLQDLLIYFHQNKDRRLYVVEKEDEWIGLLMIPGVLKEMPSVAVLQGIERLKELLQREMCRLPEIVRVEDKDLAQEVRECLREEHERRICGKRNDGEQPLLTIGIPSWNRGKRARGLVERLCKLPYDVDLEILVSNNGSDKGVEDYHEIQDMKDSRVTYFEFEENKKFHGNIAQVFRKAKGNWVLLLSDEDDIVEKQLSLYMEKLEQYKEKVAVIRPGTTKMYINMKEEYAEVGLYALEAYSLNNNYVSGATYNRKFMTGELVDKVERKWIDQYAYKAYPHMIFDWYMCLKGDFYRYPPALVLEGEAEGADENTNHIYEYNKFDNRLRQFNSYLDIINGMEETADIEKVVLFISASTKTIFLLCMLKERYSKEFGSWEICRNQALEQIKAGYGRLNMVPENLKNCEDIVSENIQRAIAQFGF